MKVGAGRSFVLAIAAFAAFLSFAAVAQAAKLPKFSVTNISSPPANAEPGDSFTGLGIVRNDGKKSGKATVRLSLRADNTPENGPIALGMTQTGKVKKGETTEFGVPATIPNDTANGTYFMVACATPAKGSGCLVSDGQVTVAESPDPQPGARTLGDELFPQTGNGGYDVSHYDIDLRYDPVENVFEAQTNTNIFATATQDLSEFSLDFQDIPVSQVTVNGVPAEFEQVDSEPPLSDNPAVTTLMKLVVTPATPILDGSDMNVEVFYAGTPVEMVDIDESVEGWIPACYTEVVEVCDGAFVVNEPNGAQAWFPANNFPTDKATYETRITVPDSYETAGIGELSSRTPVGDGTTTWRWVEDDPTSTYLTTATVGQFDFTQPAITETVDNRVIPQNNFVEATATPAQKTSIATSLGRTEAMVNFLANRFGPYPYDSGGVVADRVPGVCYALEVATKSHFAGSCATGAPGVGQSTLVHEISHQWMGDAVTLQNWTDIWFQEGFAQYVEWTWNFEDGTSVKSPGELWSENYASGPATKWNIIPTELDGDAENLFATFPTYTRGAMTLQGYREIVGSKRFYDFAREVVDRYAYDNISSEEAVDLMEEMSGFTGDDLALLDQYFQQWLYQGAKPTITPNDFD
jgi:aminopeptidase N